MSEQHIWQRRAAHVLAELLQQHKDLPVLTWTVGRAGSRLTGSIGEHDPDKVRAQFDAWKAALGIVKELQTTAAGRIYLYAEVTKRFSGLNVTVGVSAVMDEEGTG